MLGRCKANLFEADLYPSGACVECVFDKFFDGNGQRQNDLAAADAVDRVPVDRLY